MQNISQSLIYWELLMLGVENETSNINFHLFSPMNLKKNVLFHSYKHTNPTTIIESPSNILRNTFQKKSNMATKLSAESE